MKRFSFLLFTFFLLSSCGLFLQKTGIKNYSLPEKTPQSGLNDYQYDFLYLTQLVEEGFPRLDSIFPLPKRTSLTRQILARLADAETNSDFILQARKYLSNLKNQHTSIHLKQKFRGFYPYIIFISSDDWYLFNLPKQYDSLYIGQKIIEINGQRCSEIAEKLADFTSAENKIGQQFQIRNLQLYNNPQYLMEIGVIQQRTDTLTLKFEDQTEINLAFASEIELFDLALPEHRITRYRDETYLYNIYQDEGFGYLQWNRCHDKIDIQEGIENYVKPWLQPFARSYVKRQFKKDRPSERISAYYNPEYPVFKEFVRELIDSLNAADVENLVIDLRNNPGGNLILGLQLLYFLTDRDSLKGFTEYTFTSELHQSYFPDEYQRLKEKYPLGWPQRELVRTDQGNNLFHEIRNKNSIYHIPDNRPVFEGDIYLLANYKTGSAAAMLTSLFQDNGIGTVIGTSVGNNPTGATTYTPMILPGTKADISIATTYIERPQKVRGKIQIPDIWVEYTVPDILNGVDPYLRIVRERIAEGNP